MSFLFLLALSKATSALLCATLSRACEKVSLLHSREVGDGGCRSKGLQLKSQLTSGRWSLMPGWEFACGPYGPERGDVHSPLGLGPQLPWCLGASPRAGLQQLCRCVQPMRVRMHPATAALPGHLQLVPGDQPTSLLLPSLSLSGLSSPRTLHAARDG